MRLLELDTVHELFLLRQNSSAKHVLQVYQMLLQVRAAVLDAIRAGLAERGFALSAARLLSYLIWLGWRDHVDAYGFGRSLQSEWQAGSVAGARANAQRAWELQLEQCMAGAEPQLASGD